MSIRYTNVINHLPETKMRLYPTKVINIIGGPGSDKSLFSAAIVLYLSLHGKTVETIPDYAKSLVWQQNHEVLKNQYFIAQRQYEMLNLIDGQVHFLITECSLPQVLFYNENYADNICDVAKTREQILDWYRQHDNTTTSTYWWSEVTKNMSAPVASRTRSKRGKLTRVCVKSWIANICLTRCWLRMSKSSMPLRLRCLSSV